MGFFHGIRATETTAMLVPFTEVPTSVIGLIATADDADASVYPLNTPVLKNGVSAALQGAGSQGTLASCLNAIGVNASPQMIVVRVKDAQSVIGSDTAGNRTGIYALLDAKSKFDVAPKINIAPGFESAEVLTALVSVNKRLRAFSYARPTGVQDIASAKAMRDKFGARELMLIYPDFTSDSNKLPTAALAAGLRAKIDKEVGWHKSLSNVPVLGPTGISKIIGFEIDNPDCEANSYNSLPVTTLIQHSGFRFWGNSTCSNQPEFVFEVATRTAQVIQDTIVNNCFEYVDQPLTVALAKNVIESINAVLRRWTARHQLHGGRCWFDPDLNPIDQLNAGKLHISYDYTPVAPLEELGLSQIITDSYLVDFALLSA